MDTYCCSKECPKGIKASDECLNKNNSAYDAALDFIAFVNECSKTCSHKNEPTQENK